MAAAYTNVCKPSALEERSEEFYGFFASRIAQYRRAVPHEGYAALARIFGRFEQTQRVALTSNLDNLHAAVGVDALRIHGDQEMFQCARMPRCCNDMFSVADFDFALDAAEHAHRFPKCTGCGGPARPAILMFEDPNWVGLSATQEQLFPSFAAHVKKRMARDPKARLVVLEIGCGDRVPTMRCMAEDLLRSLYDNATLWSDPAAQPDHSRAHLVRVNPDPLLAGIVRESCKHLAPYVLISVAAGAKDALTAIDSRIAKEK